MKKSFSEFVAEHDQWESLSTIIGYRTETLPDGTKIRKVKSVAVVKSGLVEDITHTIDLASFNDKYQLEV